MKLSTRDRIVATAVELIAQRGMAGVTMSAVAETAGVARQTLYNHFPDLEAIVLAMIEEQASSGMEQLDLVIAAAGGPAAKLEQLVRHSVAFGAHGGDVGAFEAGLSAEAQEHLANHVQGARRLIAEILESGVAEGVFRADLDVEVAALLIQQLLSKAAEAVEGTDDIARVAAEMVRLTLGGVF